MVHKDFVEPLTHAQALDTAVSALARRLDELLKLAGLPKDLATSGVTSAALDALADLRRRQPQTLQAKCHFGLDSHVEKLRLRLLKDEADDPGPLGDRPA